MQDFSAAFGLAFSLIVGADPDLIEIIGLSLRVSITAVVISALVGFPLGALTAVARFPGRQAIAVTLNALMGLPPVVVGLLVYMALSRAGPFGWMDLLYTPAAMIIAASWLHRLSPRYRARCWKICIASTTNSSARSAFRPTGSSAP
jgi:tungstate transport system permease protein